LSFSLAEGEVGVYEGTPLICRNSGLREKNSTRFSALSESAAASAIPNSFVVR
jgi:hypothetical protein